jgi:hypothetical protein
MSGIILLIKGFFIGLGLSLGFFVGISIIILIVAYAFFKYLFM